MAKTILKFPDGSTKEVPIVCAYNKDGHDILMIDTGTKDGPHKVTGVCIKDPESGLYQNIVDADIWNTVKASLVEIIHNKMPASNYKIVDSTVNCTVDYKRDLGLREDNYNAIASNYNKWISSIEVANEVNQAVAQNPQNVASAATSPNPSDLVSVMDIDLNNLTNPAPVVQTPESQPKVEQNMENAGTSLVNPSDLASVIPDLNINQMPPQGAVNEQLNQPSAIDLTSINPGSSSQPMQPMDNSSNQSVITPESLSTPSVDASINGVPLINPIEDLDDTLNNAPEVASNNVYADNVDNIIEQIRQAQTAHLEAIKSLNDEFMKKMIEYKAEISRYAEEAKAKDELAGATLLKYQNMVNNQGMQMMPQNGMVQNPGINQGVILNRAA